ncbi:HAMP domain-containing histidine kinase [Actinoplanes sp. TRM 88003]|uniref:histidine kinase n=1 Tax=Paractinoplanes aksuensis TaxID=2939490 RepID=A0ABT1E3P9_9ACTN|nr:HAMP domain-containing sensor histidine kinase [Actinoplanes aksuensis]MCO8277672.1 HAMP domain-containing histidine kinase [Actinoplanes aksuensis]
MSAAFAVGAFVLSAGVTVVSYELSRNTLFRERERTAVRATYFDATVVNAGLRGADPEVGDLLRSVDVGADRYALLYRDGQWYSRSAEPAASAAVPRGSQDMAAAGQAGAQRIVRGEGPALVVAVPLADGAVFYEIVSLAELENTLQALALVLTAVAIMVAAGGAAVGWYVTRHALRPLAAVADAAQEIGAGDMQARLDPRTEPDLVRLTTSFNHMADELDRRMQRDRRFAADVSHELRSPLQTLAASVSVIHRRRDGLDERTAAAVDMIAAEVARFQVLVNDLLELARSDQPAQRETIEIAALAERAARSCAVVGCIVEIVPGTPPSWYVDPRRVEQLLCNLVENAIRYGGGPVAIRGGRLGNSDDCYLEVDDAGPGVPEEFRSSIFDRFVRGPAAHSRGDGDGTGLGLAIVAQHASAHGGQVTIGARPGGGARFRVELEGCLR